MKIVSNTTEVLVCNLMKGSRKRAKLLTLPIPRHVLALLQERIAGYTLTNMRNLEDDINNAILAVPVTAADMLLHIPPILGPPPPLPLGPPPLLRPLLLWFIPPSPPSHLPKKQKFTTATIAKSCAVTIKRIIK